MNAAGQVAEWLPRAMGRRVRQARRNAGYETAAAFARVVGLSPAVVQRLERGRTKQMAAVLRVVRPLCGLHGHSIDRLLFGLKPAPNSLAGRARSGDWEAIEALRRDGLERAMQIVVAAEARLQQEGVRR